MDDQESSVVKEVDKQMDILPYTKRDRILTWAILIIVTANFITLMIALPWRGLF